MAEQKQREEVHASEGYMASSRCGPTGHYKLIAMINTVSGAKKGWDLTKEFVRYGVSVYHPQDLASNEAMREKLGKELSKYKERCLVLICGGDGSNTWCASLMEESMESADCFPVVIPFPMGTGNDLSRALGWGNVGISGQNQILEALGDVLFAAQTAQRWSQLDRWRLSCSRPDGDEDGLQCLPQKFV